MQRSPEASEGAINPNPLVTLNHFTRPATRPGASSACAGATGAGASSGAGAGVGAGAGADVGADAGPGIVPFACVNVVAGVGDDPGASVFLMAVVVVEVSFC